MKKLILILTITSILFGQTQTPWGGYSVSTSDNLDAISINPAGLGVKRISQIGFSISNLNSTANTYYYNLTSRSNGIASSIYTDINGKYRYSFGLGFPILKNQIYGGIQYMTEKNLRTGIIVRPFNFLSIGFTSDYSFKYNESSYRVGFALRPINHRLTIGSDFRFTPDNNTYIYETPDVFIETQLIDGLYLKSGYNLDKEDITVSISANLGGMETLLSGNSEHENQNNLSFQFYEQKRKNILNIFKPKKQKYIEMNLKGQFIEEPIKKPSPFDMSIDIPFLSQNNTKYIQLRKWIESVNQLSNNESIEGLIINLSGIQGGFAQILEARNALQNFKNSGKKIIVYARSISNLNYYFISMADEIYINDLSSVDIRGLNFEIQFFKELGDSLDIIYEVEKISPYKGAADSYTRTTMSDAMKENYGKLFTDMYSEFVKGIATGKGWTEEETKKIIDSGPYESQEAKDIGLITDIMYPDDFVKYKKKLAGSFSNIITFNKISNSLVYINDWRPDKNEEKIAIIYAVGTILNGKSQRSGRGSSTVMGDITIANAIKKAREDKSVKAIILRVNSGGGSALASDLIWKEVYNTTVKDKKNIKPFIASLSSVAASGGYYIACQADTILASPTTITGSIGVIGGRLNFSQFMERIGIHTERMVWGENADMYSSSKLWTTDERLKIKNNIISIYKTFLSRVSNGREDLDSLDVDKVGIGQVWSGLQAKEYKLIDETGGIMEAIDIAGKAANINKNKRIKIIEYPAIKRGISMKEIINSSTHKSISIELSGSLNEIQNKLERLPRFDNDRIQLIMMNDIIIK